MTQTNYFALPGLAQQPDTTPEEIIAAVAAACDYTTDSLMMVNRNRRRVAARYIAMVCIRRMTGRSLKEVGQLFGKDHTTVIHAQEAVADGVAVSDPLYMDLVSRVAVNAGIDIRAPSKFRHSQGMRAAGRFIKA